MKTFAYLLHDIKYLEPLYHREHLSQAVYPDRHEPSTLTTDAWLDRLLIHQYGTNLKARRDHLKYVHGIHRLGPIIIDEHTNFVMFPLTSSVHKNALWLNAHSLLCFSAPKTESGRATRIHFSDGTFKDIDVDTKFCEKQYEKTLTVLDKVQKIRRHPELYFTAQGKFK
ncbi:competence protein ComK [Salinicoccus halitifaciens]|uniref:Competence protein ComK n=1 Tax=Salinicoccus halitifaciens TaxID=1073415 RepID=A0ABV2ECE8_9STAP|nr:competence protein ComK [Salinicoccus halitifaciens]MCD2138731.1 competence protein ComK [Salinicoccus halitifaciens]